MESPFFILLLFFLTIIGTRQPTHARIEASRGGIQLTAVGDGNGGRMYAVVYSSTINRRGPFVLVHETGSRAHCDNPTAKRAFQAQQAVVYSYMKNSKIRRPRH